MPHLFSDKARAKELLGVGQKPQSAVTSWVNRICEPADSVTETDINQFIVELVEVINLQPTGPEEASRAIRKQLKHGQAPQQKKALSLLESLVINGGTKFQTTFADVRMVDCIKLIVYDPRTDHAVQRQTMIMLAQWSKNFKSDPQMSTVSGLYTLCGGNHKLGRIKSSATNEASIIVDTMIKDIEKESSNLSAEPLKNRGKSHQKSKTKDVKPKKIKSPIDGRFRTDLPDSSATDAEFFSKFNLDKEAPNILKVVATAAQCANNLVNRLQIMDHVKNDVHLDAKVQATLERTKVVQKTLIRYIRIVTEHDVNGEYIGTLLNTNAQVVASLELYDLLADPSKTPQELEPTTSRLKNLAFQPAPTPTHQEPNLFDDPLVPLSPLSHNSSLTNNQEDLLGLDFGAGDDARLPLPILPDSFSRSTTSGQHGKGQNDYDPGTLSDFSDFESGSEEDGLEATPPNNHYSGTLSGLSASEFGFSSNVHHPGSGKVMEKNVANKQEDANPFADPFLTDAKGKQSSSSYT